MRRGVDHSKDQTYFLFGLTQEQLARTDFPLGGFTKPQVRELARELGLPVADKPDSQEICFVPNGDYAAFIDAYFREQRHRPGENPGRDRRHRRPRARRALRRASLHRRPAPRPRGSPRASLSTSSPPSPPRSASSSAATRTLLRATLTANDVNWISIAPIAAPIRAQVKIRNKHARRRRDHLPHRRSHSRRSSLRRTAARRHARPSRGALRWRSGARRRVDRVHCEY